MEDITTSNNIHIASVEPQEECFCTDDGWSHVFTFLGKGHYLLLALVSKRFAKLYAKLYQKITYGDISGHCLTYAKFFLSEWRQNLPFQSDGMHNRVKYRDDAEFTLSYIERCAAKCGTIDILEWIYELEGDYRLELLFTPLEGKEARGRLVRRMAVVQAGEVAAEANQVLVLEYLLEKYRLIEKDISFFYKFVKYAAGKGHLQCIKFLYENGCCRKITERIYDCQSAARHGQLECLRYLKEQAWPVDTSVIFEAAEAGHLHCIEYLRSVGCPWNAIYVGEDEIQVDDSHAGDVMEACAGSSLECLRYCHDNGCNADFNACCIAAVRNGKIDCIEYLRSKGCQWSSEFTEAAAEHDQLDCLQYLYGNGCPWNQNICVKSVHGDASRCLQYLHENGCEWQPEVLILKALRRGRLNCLKYVLRVGATLPNNYESISFQGEFVPDPIPRRGARRVFPLKHEREECFGYCLQYLKETGHDSRDLMLKAIQHGLAQTLQHLSSEEMKDDTTLSAYAANHGQVECLTYLHENGFRWDGDSYTGYFENVNISLMPTHMDCLRYMKEHQLDTNQDALLNNIRAGHVYCVDLLIKDEWKSDGTFCMEAVRTGNRKCFELLVEKGFAFDPKLCAIEAARLGIVEFLEYFHLNGFALPEEALDAAESNGHLECVEYIKQHSQCQCKSETSRKRSANDAKLDHL
ncbi:hypothetical protein CTEN210_00682 [Chaetoceros tenuissimus]|uniref:Uncharacterized protein n=1 Tax=Chaetoceros tenuissimus TaxID=426638 RepID=A0AAD3GZ64_9STRA|nr:hypothetical protein CTEN210_00682 [Chaetoceros tenuissimus]